MNDNGTILIVEDNEMSLKMAKSLLQMAGYKTLEADNADLGIRLAQEHHPHLILMDMHLPVKSGYEASRELKNDPKTGNIPIVAFTALAMQEEQQRAIAHGCAGVISKPIDIKQFSKTVETFLSASQPLLDEPGLIAQASDTQPETTECIHCAETKKLKQDLEEFLFHVSHDLQGPLRKIQQFARFIEHPEEAFGDEGDKPVYIQGISRSARETENLLQRLMTLACVHARGGAFTEISLNDLVKNALSRYRDQIQARNAQVEVGELARLQGDPRQIQMVFEEVLENALKFQAEDRQPVIHIYGAQLDNALYEITIEDNGIGLAGEDTDLIFKPFQRLNAASRFPGEGMGLAIAKKIVARHRGDITAQNNSPSGTIIKIRLPIHPQGA